MGGATHRRMLTTVRYPAERHAISYTGREDGTEGSPKPCRVQDPCLP